MKLNSQEKRDLDKFAKFLALKATQIIIQSRLGEKVSTICKPEVVGGTDWFNLNITDIPEVLADSKKVLNGEILSSRLPLCVEISLVTSEGDQMVLEAWCLGLSPEKCEPTPRITNTIYNRMGILLKSLVTTTRFVPAYKLSRMQSSDSFLLCYRIYMGEPLEQCLGEGYKHVVIGQICSPIGTFQLSVSYRTKLTISPTQSERNNQITAIHDQLKSNSDPTLRKEENWEDEIKRRNKLYAFVDESKKKDLIEKLRILKSKPYLPECAKTFWEEKAKFNEKCNAALAELEQKRNESFIEYNMEMLEMDSSTDSDDFYSVQMKFPSDHIYRNIHYFRLESFTDRSPNEETSLAETFQSDLKEYEELIEELNEIDEND